MIVLAGEWIKSKYITIDEDGWHCSPDAPEDIRKQYDEFMSMVNTSMESIEDVDE